MEERTLRDGGTYKLVIRHLAPFEQGDPNPLLIAKDLIGGRAVAPPPEAIGGSFEQVMAMRMFETWVASKILMDCKLVVEVVNVVASGEVRVGVFLGERQEYEGKVYFVPVYNTLSAFTGDTYDEAMAYVREATKQLGGVLANREEKTVVIYKEI